VAHSLSAKKRIRQNVKRRARNRARKEVLKNQVKSFLGALTGQDVSKAKDEFRKTVQRLDKTAAKHTIHKNAASRKRSRLAKRLNSMIATGGAPKATGKGSRAAKAQS
jgi:small subunit ribosomal protein S20